MEGNYNNLFNYKILYSKRRKKTVGFKIVDNTFIIRSPINISKNFLMTLIEKRKNWVIERIQNNKNKVNLINNDNIYYLGEKINIKIKETELLNTGGYCELYNNIFYITISKNYTKLLLEKIIKKWYKEQCLKIVKERAEYFALKYNLKYSKITIKEQKTVWGTCNYKNDLTFNLKIMMFEREIIDYLVVHELSHTIYKNHSIQYWKMVKNILPNYKELDNKLKNYKLF